MEMIAFLVRNERPIVSRTSAALYRGVMHTPRRDIEIEALKERERARESSLAWRGGFSEDDDERLDAMQREAEHDLNQGSQ